MICKQIWTCMCYNADMGIRGKLSAISSVLLFLLWVSGIELWPSGLLSKFFYLLSHLAATWIV